MRTNALLAVGLLLGVTVSAQTRTNAQGTAWSKGLTSPSWEVRFHSQRQIAMADGTNGVATLENMFFGTFWRQDLEAEIGRLGDRRNADLSYGGALANAALAVARSRKPDFLPLLVRYYYGSARHAAELDDAAQIRRAVGMVVEESPEWVSHTEQIQHGDASIKGVGGKGVRTVEVRTRNGWKWRVLLHEVHLQHDDTHVWLPIDRELVEGVVD